MATPSPEPLAPEPRPRFRRSRATGRPRLSGRVLGLALGAGLLVAALAAYLLGRPRLAFTNRLAAPVRLVVGRNPPRSVAPGETIRQSLSHGGSVLAQWELVRPLSADGRPMGSEIRGSIVMAEGRAYVTDQSGSTLVFKPNPEKLEILARNNLGEHCNSTPAFSNGQIFLRTFENLWCIEAK